MSSPEATKTAIEETHRLFRRKPLTVKAEQVHKKQTLQLPQLGVPVTLEPGDWIVEEGGLRTVVKLADFDKLYEATDGTSADDVAAGMPELDLGSTIEKDGRRLVRVEVVSGQGAIAYWHRGQPTGALANWQVVADNIDAIQASHRAGRFVEPYESKPGGRTWVVLAAGRS